MYRTITIYLLSITICGEIIPTNRRITWQSNIGIPSGIPRRTTIYTNMTGINSTGTADVTSAINAALAACPSNQVVLLPAGLFRIISPLIIPTGVTFRGAGTNTTLLATNHSGNAIIQFGSNNNAGLPWYPSPSIERNVTSGETQGSTTITLNSSTGFSVGGYFLIDCLSNSLATSYGGEGIGDFNSRDSGLRPMQQIVEITGVSGNDISFTPALYMT